MSNPETLAPAEPGTDDWAAAFFRDVDTFRLEKLADWLSSDVEVRFGNNPPVHGHDDAVAAFGGFFSTIAGISHARETVVVDGDLATQQSVVTYTRPGGGTVSMPVASHLRRVGPAKIDRLWIYIDMAPLYASDVAAV